MINAIFLTIGVMFLILATLARLTLFRNEAVYDLRSRINNACYQWSIGNLTETSAYEWAYKLLPSYYRMVLSFKPVTARAWLPKDVCDKLLLSTIFILLFTFAASAQTNEITLTRDEAIACDKCFDESKAKDARIADLEKIVEKLNLEINRQEKEKTQYFAELQTTKAEAARYFSLVQLCVQKGRVKQFGLFNTKIGGN